MPQIALPNNITFKKGETKNKGIVTVEPCFPGYGITIGNALRRVLLSSLGGAAVSGVKIEGVDHEFMTLQHVKEDVLEVLLNVKKLRCKVHTDEPVKLILEAHGEKTVTAKDIKKNSDVEVANEDLEIANITDMAGSLKMEISIKRGIGYETIDNREKQSKDIGYIDIDSIYSPIQEVGIDLQNIRVGNMTNWEKLVLNITTDGTITPEEAFNKAVEILISQFKSLINYVDADELEEKLAKEAAAKEEEEKTEESSDEKDEKTAKEEEEEVEEKPKKKRGRPKKIDK